jgi:hypothetical protein
LEPKAGEPGAVTVPPAHVPGAGPYMYGPNAGPHAALRGARMRAPYDGALCAVVVGTCADRKTSSVRTLGR